MYRKSMLWCSTIRRLIRRASVIELEGQRGWAVKGEHGCYSWAMNGSMSVSNITLSLTVVNVIGLIKRRSPLGSQNPSEGEKVSAQTTRSS